MIQAALEAKLLVLQYKCTICKGDFMFVYCLNHLNLGHVLELGSEFSIFFSSFTFVC